MLIKNKESYIGAMCTNEETGVMAYTNKWKYLTGFETTYFWIWNSKKVL